MRLTLPHYFNFGEDAAAVGGRLDNSDAWDGLRTETSGPFAMAVTRDEMNALADRHPDIGERAAAILAQCPGARTIVSYGVGAAILETWLLRHRPDLTLTVTDYGRATVGRLRSLLPVTVEHHDLLRDAPCAADVQLFHRIDTEFTNRKWRQIFRAFADETVIFVPGGMKSDEDMWQHMRQLRRKRRQGTHAGYLRTSAALESLWSRTHRHERFRADDHDAWLLSPR